MARLVTAGCELGHINGESHPKLAGTAPTATATITHGGDYAYKADPTAQSGIYFDFAPSTNQRWYFFRGWFRLDGYPTVSGANRWMKLTRWGTSPTLETDAMVGPDGKLSFNCGQATVAIYTSPDPLPLNTWFCIEIAAKVTTNTRVDTIYRYNDQTVATGGYTIATVAPPTRVDCGTPATSGVNTYPTVWFDDIAINDDTGSQQNTWPGADGKIIYLHPTSDNTVGTDWKNNTNTAFSPGAYDCLDNRPPRPQAFGTASTGQDQVRNATSNTTSPAANLDLNLKTYTAAGIAANDSITTIQPIGILGDNSGTSQFQIAQQLLSNPAEPSETVHTTIASSTSTNLNTGSWLWAKNPTIYTPTVDKSTSPVIRIGKRSLTTTSVGACALGAIVEYTEATASQQRFLAVA